MMWLWGDCWWLVNALHGKRDWWAVSLHLTFQLSFQFLCANLECSDNVRTMLGQCYGSYTRSQSMLNIQGFMVFEKVHRCSRHLANVVPQNHALNFEAIKKIMIDVFSPPPNPAALILTDWLQQERRPLTAAGSRQFSSCGSQSRPPPRWWWAPAASLPPPRQHGSPDGQWGRRQLHHNMEKHSKC